MQRKAQRPKNFNPKKIPFPVWVMPKIDGARGLNMGAGLLARTLKKFKNYHTTAFFSGPEYFGLDGELAAQDEKHPDLCRLTSSAINSYEGEPFVLWHIFDYITEDTVGLPYCERRAALEAYISTMQAQGYCGHLRVVPYTVCNSMQALQAAHDGYMQQGYEGSCVWNPLGMHKEGDCSPINGPVWRIKDFIDMEMIIDEILEGETNNNEPQVNELGRQYRTSHQENKSSSGMIGTINGTALDDVFDLYDPKLKLIAKGQKVTMSPGKMSHADRIYYFNNPHLILKQIGKGKFFPKGIKDAPRFMQFQCFRDQVDI